MHAVGFHRFVVENFTGETLEGMKESEVKEFDPPSEVGISSESRQTTLLSHLASSHPSDSRVNSQVRALIEGQFLSMRGHAERLGMPIPPIRIIATGGASANTTILGSLSSIFGCDIYTVQRPGMHSVVISLIIHLS